MTVKRNQRLTGFFFSFASPETEKVIGSCH